MFRLRKLRQDKELTLIELASDFEISMQVLSRYEREERQADYSMLIKFANYFDCSLDYLLGRTDTPGFSPAEQSLGFSETKKEVVTQLEDDLLTEFRELGEIKGKPFQESVILYIKQLKNI